MSSYHRHPKHDSDARPPSARRTTHTSRRMVEHEGKPMMEVVETTEEVITRDRPTPVPPVDLSRLAPQGNDRGTRRHQSSPAATGGAPSGRGTPRSVVPNSNRYMSITNRGPTPRGHASTPPGSQPSSATRRLGGASGLVESPAHIEDMDDYETPPRQRRGDGRYVYDYGNGYNAAAGPQNGRQQSKKLTDAPAAPAPARPRRGSYAPSANYTDIAVEDDDLQSKKQGSFHFRVRVHECDGVFADLEKDGRAAPAVYFALHTVEKRGHTGVSSAGTYNPIFNDEFVFTSANPEQDALVCTLVAVPASASSQRREKKVAECVLALHNVAWREERMVWVPLVRHPGTEKSYEQGEVRVSIYSEDFGYDEVASEEAEAQCSEAIHSALIRYAPKELHRLDWLTAAYVDKGPEAWNQLQASYRSRTVGPAAVKLTVQRVDGLTDDVGRPISACDVQVAVDDGHTEQQSKTVPYRHRATIKQEFHLTLLNPDVDTMSITVFCNGRRLGEAVAGLTNVKAGVAKEVTLMLVRAAETGDASNGGQVHLTLRTDTYSSPYQMSATAEEKLRNRVRNYLWSYLRDDLHRLDAIVSGIDDEEVYMQEWARTIGPEPKPRRLTVVVRGASDMAVGSTGLPPRCYARVSVGPETRRTELAISRNSGVVFKSPVHIQVLDPKVDAVEVMLIADGDDGDKEISRVTFGVANLPLGRPVARTLHLVTDAGKRTARVQGNVILELLAEDFGCTGSDAEAVVTTITSATSPQTQRLEGIMQRGAPERLHRVPYVLDTAAPGDVDRVVESEAKQCGTEVAVAPMTVKILGVKSFKPATDFYVKVYLNNEGILRTDDVKGGTDVLLNIDDNNEATRRLGNAAQSIMTFKVAHHRPLLKTVVYGEAEVALSTLIRGEKNVLWLPFFHSAGTAHPPRGSALCRTNKPEQSVKVKGNRMPGAANANGAAPGELLGDRTVHAHGGASPVGLLGVELQSMAFPNTTVMEYRIKGEAGGERSVPAQVVVTRDVTSLLAKMKPSELSKVQPLIAQCSSLKDAHAELRAQYSSVPIAGTVYVEVKSVELATPEGQFQEGQGGIAVEASFGSERQTARKRVDFTEDVAHRVRQHYPQLRLDIPESVVNGNAKSGARAAADKVNGAPALELRLIGVAPRGGRAGSGSHKRAESAAPAVAAYADPNTSGAGGVYEYDVADNQSNGTADSYYVGGENNINRYMKGTAHHNHHWGIQQPEAERTGRPSKMLISQLQQQEQVQSGRTAVPPPALTWHQNSARHYNGNQQGSGYGYQANADLYGNDDNEEDSEKYFLGGVNNIRSYVDAPTRSSSRHQSPVRPDYTSHSNNRYYGNSSNGGRTVSSSPAGAQGVLTTPTTTIAAGAVPYRGEIGVVRLSLRALLTTPLYRIGDTLRVPIVAPAMVPEKLSYRARRSSEVNQRCVVGHVTLRVALPAFEYIPESLRLGSRHMMSTVVPNYVHYYEHRIGAYMRDHNALDLVSLHYNLYERDIASGSWPVSLYDWLQALIKSYGPETATFGPEPPLPFDPEEWERARLRDQALRREWEAAFATNSKENAASEEELYSPHNGGAEAGVGAASAGSGAIPPAPAASAGGSRRTKESPKAPAEATYSF